VSMRPMPPRMSVLVRSPKGRGCVMPSEFDIEVMAEQFALEEAGADEAAFEALEAALSEREVA